MVGFHVPQFLDGMHFADFLFNLYFVLYSFTSEGLCPI